jgi:hypothetical protein
VRSIVLGARSSLIAFVITGLISLPATAASSRPLATVVSAQSALLANADAIPGANVYLDDDLVTQGGGSLRLSVGASQVYLLEESEAVLQQNQDKIQAKMYRGTLGFGTSSPDDLAVDTPFGVVRGADGSRVLGQISLVAAPKISDERIEVTSYQGTLVVVDKAGRSQTIEEGQSYIGTMASDDAGGGGGDAKVQGVGSSGTNWKRVLAVVIPIGLVTGAAVALYVHGSESCAQPNCNQ